MDRCAILIDGRHVLAEGGKLCVGRGRRDKFVCDVPGGAFALSWLDKATQPEIVELSARYPRIPKELDVQLVLNAEATLGSLRERQDYKRLLRQGFWDAVRSARGRFRPTSLR